MMQIGNSNANRKRKQATIAMSNTGKRLWTDDKILGTASSGGSSVRTYLNGGLSIPASTRMLAFQSLDEHISDSLRVQPDSAGFFKLRSTYDALHICPTQEKLKSVSEFPTTNTETDYGISLPNGEDRHRSSRVTSTMRKPAKMYNEILEQYPKMDLYQGSPVTQPSASSFQKYARSLAPTVDDVDPEIEIENSSGSSSSENLRTSGSNSRILNLTNSARTRGDVRSVLYNRLFDIPHNNNEPEIQSKFTSCGDVKKKHRMVDVRNTLRIKPASNDIHQGPLLQPSHVIHQQSLGQGLLSPDHQYSRPVEQLQRSSDENVSSATGTGCIKKAFTTAAASHEPPRHSEKAPRQHSSTVPDESPDDKWNCVGIFTGQSNLVVTSYIDHNEWNSSMLDNLTSDNLPDLSQYNRTNLEPGACYRFRVCAINSVGRSEWTRSIVYQTKLSGYPNPPRSIKISRVSNGVRVSWEPPNESEEIVEYSVYLAVKQQITLQNQEKAGLLSFMHFYRGLNNWCLVPYSSLLNAYVDHSSKPANIFRIVACNKKGYGHATQVRWIRDLAELRDLDMRIIGSSGGTPGENSFTQ